MSRAALLLGLVALSACNTVPAYVTQPLQMPEGGLGFSVRGIAAYTRDQTKTAEEVRKVLEASCGGPVEVTSIGFQDASSKAGVPHLAYTATATCLE